MKTGNDALSTGTYLWATVIGTSMTPGLPPGSLIGIQPLTPDEIDSLQPGAVLVVRASDAGNSTGTDGEHWVAHRLRKKQGGSLILQGDRLSYSDPEALGAESVIGQVEWARPPIKGLERRGLRPNPAMGRLFAISMGLPGGRLGAFVGRLLRLLFSPWGWTLASGEGLPPNLGQEPNQGQSVDSKATREGYCMDGEEAKQNETSAASASTLAGAIRARFESQNLGEELVLHDRKTGAVHVLNSSAQLLWEGIAANRTEQEVLESYMAHFAGLPEAQARLDYREIRKTLGLDS